MLDRIKRYFFQMKFLIIRSGWKKAKFIKRKNIFSKFGENCSYSSNILPAEPFLVEIHNNVVISANVRLITHSAVHEVFNKEENTKNHLCQFGKIVINDNVYIGANAIIMYGVTIGQNCIIAAGAIVTKNIPENSVVGGIPAKFIESYDEAKLKSLRYSNDFIDCMPDTQVRDMIDRRKK